MFMMKILTKNICVVFSILLLASLFLLAQIPAARAEESTAESKTLAYLSDVVGLDLSKYTITGGIVNFPASYSNSINNYWKQENVDYHLNATNSQMTATFNFQNGIIEFCFITIQQGLPIYSQQPSSNSLDTTQDFLKRYQNYASKYYDVDTSYLQPMRDSLSEMVELSSATSVEGNTKLQVTVSEETQLQWTYTENEIEIQNKQVVLTLSDGNFRSFRDTWPLYTVGTTNAISKDEALKLALAATNNYDISFVSEDNSVQKIKLNLTNSTCESWLTMMPRDTPTLYPIWRFQIQFEEPLYGVVGLQIGVWGDTQEISYVESYGYLGTQSLTPQPSTQNENNAMQSTCFIITVATVVAICFLAIFIAIKNRKNN
jgi:hypothetical protein